jgi:hypothetical protein
MDNRSIKLSLLKITGEEDHFLALHARENSAALVTNRGIHIIINLCNRIERPVQLQCFTIQAVLHPVTVLVCLDANVYRWMVGIRTM